MKQEEKVSLHSTFDVGSGIWDEKKNVWIRIRDEKMVGTGIKHPGSATLSVFLVLFLFPVYPCKELKSPVVR
jgi:hypothetical protein